MAQSEYQSKSFQALQKRLETQKIGKKETRGGKEFFTFTQKNLSDKDVERLRKEVSAYETAPTVREEKKERKRVADDLQEFYNRTQKEMGSKKRIQKMDDKYINKLWKIYNRYFRDDFKAQEEYGSDQIIDAIKMNIKDTNKKIVSKIQDAIENDESIITEEMEEEIRRKRASKTGVRF